jgi:hypothetical protein
MQRRTTSWCDQALKQDVSLPKSEEQKAKGAALTIGMPCSSPLTRKAKTPPMTTTMKGAMADTQNKFGIFFL